MNRSLRLLVVALSFAAAVTLCGAGNTAAQGPVAQNSMAFLATPGLPDVSMFLVPDGTGSPFSNCFQRGGNQVTAQIIVTLLDASFMPVPNWPATNVRLEHSLSPLIWCPNIFYPPPNHAPNLADGPTNAAGQTTFTMSYHGGGWVVGPTFVWVLEASGTWAQIPVPLNVAYNSGDINGDLVINLVDVGIFAAIFYGPYHYKADFNFDHLVNLIDVAMLAGVYGASCP